ncbi:MAG: sulfotransferase domain-containing protein [Pseudomonadota bacterium]
MRDIDCASHAPEGLSGTERAALVGAIGIGAQKCASSWIHAIAGSHPNIGVGDPKELDFFSYYFDRGYQWYERHFSPEEEHTLQFENSPSYFYDHRAPARARAYNADLKIVLLLREPVKRAFSNHLHEVIKGHIDPVSFEEGLANNPVYVEQGLYATHLSAWYEVFPKDQILVLFAEDISRAPGEAAQTLFRFLGVDTAFDSAILHERRNESDRARLQTLRTGLRAGGDWMRRRGLESTLARVKSVGPVASLLRANSVDVRSEVPAMRPETEQTLTEHFAGEMARLRQMLELEQLPWDPQQ